MALFKKKTTSSSKNSVVKTIWRAVKKTPIVRAISVVKKVVNAVKQTDFGKKVTAAINSAKTYVTTKVTEIINSPVGRFVTNLVKPAVNTVANAVQAFKESDTGKSVSEFIDNVEEFVDENIIEPIKEVEEEETLSDVVINAILDVEDDGREQEIDIEVDASDTEEDPKGLLDRVLNDVVDFFKESEFGKDLFGAPDVNLEVEAEGEDEVESGLKESEGETCRETILERIAAEIYGRQDIGAKRLNDIIDRTTGAFRPKNIMIGYSTIDTPYYRSDIVNNYLKNLVVNISRARFRNGIYDSEDDAAYAFGQAAIPMTSQDNRERGAVIKPIPVLKRDSGGDIVRETQYTFGNIYKGGHSNVVFGTVVNKLVQFFIPGKVSYAHTHPNCYHASPDGEDDYFHRSNEFSSHPGDETVARWPDVNNMYLASPSDGMLYVYDESDNADPKELEVKEGLPQFQAKEEKWRKWDIFR